VFLLFSLFSTAEAFDRVRKPSYHEMRHFPAAWVLLCLQRGSGGAVLGYSPGKECGAFRAWKAKQLSPRKSTPKTTTPEAEETVQAQEPVQEQVAAQHDHDHDGHDHEGHDHTHEHEHGPVFNPDCSREMVLDVPVEDVDKAYRTVTANYRKYARIPGFRPGKCPESVVKRRFASEIRKDVLDGLLPERFNKAVLDLGIKPVGQPQVTELSVEEGQPLHVKAVFEFLPEFSIDGYKDIKVEKTSIEVTDEEFQQELEHLRESRATIEPVEEDRKLQDGDWAEISYKGIISGDDNAKPVEGVSALVEIGGKDTVEAFTKILRGSKVGDALKAEVVYPEDYAQSELAGKTVAYDVEVKAIKKRTLPELNDDFAKELGEYENLEALKTRIREYLENQKKQGVEAETKNRLFAAMGEKFTFAVPESLVQFKIDERLERGLRALAAQGMGAEQLRKLDFSRLRAAQRDGALTEVKTELLLDRIANEEEITVSDEDLESELQMAAIQSREPLETLRARLEQDGSITRIRMQMVREKTAQALYERL